MSIVAANFVDALPDPYSIIMRMVSVEAETVSLSIRREPTTSFFDAKVVIGTSKIIILAASEVTTTGTNFKVLGFTIVV